MGKPLDLAETDRSLVPALRAGTGRSRAESRAAGQVRASLPLADLLVALWLALSVCAVLAMGMIRL